MLFVRLLLAVESLLGFMATSEENWSGAPNSEGDMDRVGQGEGPNRGRVGP